MENLPIYIHQIFVLTTLVTVFIFYKATHQSAVTLIVLTAWLVLQALVSLTGFYLDTSTLPPRFILLPLPPVLLILFLFFTAKGRAYIDRLNIKLLTLLHIVRIPVEIVLYMLFVNKGVPELMTFEGRNFDILSGITAPIIYYYGYVTKTLPRWVILAWNFICLVLLFNIVIHAVFSVPFAFQKFAFEQPNIAVLYFPFVWLPACVVPLVLFSHLAAIRSLIKRGHFKGTLATHA